MQRFVIIPLFLFGGAFYPISQLPGWLQAAIEILPLWHGVELARAFTVGHFDGSATLVHVAVLCAGSSAERCSPTDYVRRRLYV